MSRELRSVSLPVEYWEKLDSMVGDKFIRSRGDAIMVLIDKLYPTFNDGEKINVL